MKVLVPFKTLDYVANFTKYSIFCNDSSLQKWTDEYLQWDPDEWDGIYNITLHCNDIWRPDLTLVQK